MGSLWVEINSRKRYSEARKAFEKAGAWGDADARSALEILRQEGR